MSRLTAPASALYTRLSVSSLSFQATNEWCSLCIGGSQSSVAAVAFFINHLCTLCIESSVPRSVHVCCSEAKRMNLAKFASVMMYDGNVHAPLNRPHGGNERFAEFGTVASLDTVFESHPLVKHALAGEVALTNTFLVQGDEEVDNIFNNSPITQLYSPHRCHRKTVSRYASLSVTMPHLMCCFHSACHHVFNQELCYMPITCGDR